MYNDSRAGYGPAKPAHDRCRTAWTRERVHSTAKETERRKLRPKFSLWLASQPAGEFGRIVPERCGLRGYYQSAGVTGAAEQPPSSAVSAADGGTKSDLSGQAQWRSDPVLKAIFGGVFAG